MKKILYILVLFLMFIPNVLAEETTVNIYLFHSDECPHCNKEIKLLNELEEQYPYIKVYKYEISKDELIIKRGFFKQRTNTTELYLLKDPDLTVNLYQRIIGVGTITALIDTHSGSARAGQKVVLRNVQEAEKVRKLLRDSIEADVMERKITYFDKV